MAAVGRDGNSGIAEKVVAPVGSWTQYRGNPEWGMGIQQGGIGAQYGASAPPFPFS